MDNTLFLVNVVISWIVIIFNLILTFALIKQINVVSSSLPPKPDILKPGETAPDFSAITADNKPVSLETFIQRDTAFVAVSPTCAPCRQKIPQLQIISTNADRAGVNLVLVSIADITDTKVMLNELNVTMPVIIAPPTEGSFQDLYKVQGTPSYSYITPDKKVEAAGWLSDQAWQNLIEEWQRY